MKKKLRIALVSALVLGSLSYGNAQNKSWGNWFVPIDCLKQIQARLRFDGENQFATANTGRYQWMFSISNGYAQDISFDLNLLSPQSYSEFQNGQRRNLDGYVGRMTVKAGESLNWGGFDILNHSNTQVYFWIRNVRFGNDDNSAPFANDDCGHTTRDY